jgi:hypothetical protein
MGQSVVVVSSKGRLRAFRSRAAAFVALGNPAPAFQMATVPVEGAPDAVAAGRAPSGARVDVVVGAPEAGYLSAPGAIVAGVCPTRALAQEVRRAANQRWGRTPGTIGAFRIVLQKVL